MIFETIRVYYQKLGNFQGVDYYHETLVYTKSDGTILIATSGATQKPSGSDYDNVSQAANAAAHGEASVYGTLKARVGDQMAFSISDLQLMIGGYIPGTTQNPSSTITSGNDLSSQWNDIVSAYTNISNKNLPYSPLTQNSNSLATSALIYAGLFPPSDTGLFSSHWTPAAGNNLLTQKTGGGYCLPISALFNRAMTDPIVLDLSTNGSGIQLTSLANSKASFDLTGNGFAVRTGWVGPQTGLLAIDKNNNGKIDNITELFGNDATDGFTALKAYDTNHDGRITAADSGFASLRVWADANGDGVTQTGELKTLAELGITGINIYAQPVDVSIILPACGNKTSNVSNASRVN